MWLWFRLVLPEIDPWKAISPLFFSCNLEVDCFHQSGPVIDMELALLSCHYGCAIYLDLEIQNHLKQPFTLIHVSWIKWVLMFYQLLMLFFLSQRRNPEFVYWEAYYWEDVRCTCLLGQAVVFSWHIWHLSLLGFLSFFPTRSVLVTFWDQASARVL